METLEEGKEAGKVGWERAGGGGGVRRMMIHQVSNMVGR